MIERGFAAPPKHSFLLFAAYDLMNLYNFQSHYRRPCQMLQARALEEICAAHLYNTKYACTLKKPIKYLNPVLSSKAEQQR